MEEICYMKEDVSSLWGDILLLGLLGFLLYFCIKMIRKNWDNGLILHIFYSSPFYIGFIFALCDIFHTAYSDLTNFIKYDINSELFLGIIFWVVTWQFVFFLPATILGIIYTYIRRFDRHFMLKLLAISLIGGVIFTFWIGFLALNEFVIKHSVFLYFEKMISCWYIEDFVNDMIDDDKIDDITFFAFAICAIATLVTVLIIEYILKKRHLLQQEKDKSFLQNENEMKKMENKKILNMFMLSSSVMVLILFSILGSILFIIPAILVGIFLIFIRRFEMKLWLKKVLSSIFGGLLSYIMMDLWVGDKSLGEVKFEYIFFGCVFLSLGIITPIINILIIENKLKKRRLLQQKKDKQSSQNAQE